MKTLPGQTAEGIFGLCINNISGIEEEQKGRNTLKIQCLETRELRHPLSPLAEDLPANSPQLLL